MVDFLIIKMSMANFLIIRDGHFVLWQICWFVL